MNGIANALGEELRRRTHAQRTGPVPGGHTIPQHATLGRERVVWAANVPERMFADLRVPIEIPAVALMELCRAVPPVRIVVGQQGQFTALDENHHPIAGARTGVIVNSEVTIRPGGIHEYRFEAELDPVETPPAIPPLYGLLRIQHEMFYDLEDNLRPAPQPGAHLQVIEHRVRVCTEDEAARGLSNARLHNWEYSPVDGYDIVIRGNEEAPF